MTTPPPSDRDLLARIVDADFGAGDPAARARLAARIDRDAATQAKHDDILFLWDMLGELKPPASNKAEAAPSADNVVPLRRRIAARTGRIAVRVFAGAAACSLVFAASVGLLDGTTGTAHAFVIETGKAERRVAELPDGSTVELSGESRVTVRYDKGARELSLDDGEAYVKVAKGQAPLLIRSGGGEIRTAGAADVKLVRDDVLVTMIDGNADVAVANAEGRTLQSTALRSGQQIRLAAFRGVAPGSMLTTPRSVSVAGALGWTRGILEFQGEPLGDVIDEVNRHAAGRVVLLDPSQANTPVYGVLHIGDLDGLASILADQQTAKGRFAPIVRVDAAPD